MQPKPAGAIHRGDPSQVALTIGRLSDNDVAIPSPLVSRYHARLIQSANSYQIVDLGSTNGTFVNGRRVEGQHRLTDGDHVQFGSYTFQYAEGRLTALEGAGGVSITARRLSKNVKDAASGKRKDLLSGINLAIYPGEFVGIFGTSGSGKSTLMDALNGRRPASSGSVLYNGTDLYQSFDLFKPTIGYVPQQDIVHRKISVHNALSYTARLRLPEDTTRDEVEQSIVRALQRVELTDKVRQPIDTPTPLSGGQLKRVNLAIELVSNPSVLFLDEATSGLDAGTDKKMMQLFRDLAGDGRTVVCVTHTLENVDSCHLVVVLFRGRLVYFGPPREVVKHFGLRRLSDVYETLEAKPPEWWVAQYENSPLYQQYIGHRFAVGASGQLDLGHSAPDSKNGEWAETSFDWHQTRILCRRFLDLLASDKRNLLLLLAQAPIIGLVIGLVFNTNGSLPDRGYAESQIMFMLALSAIWLGCLNSAREIVKELPIYLRERSVNLKVGPYLASKLIPLTGLCIVQCGVLLAVVSELISIPGSVAARALVLTLTAVAATAMGLTVSALVTSADKAVGLIPILLIPQVILSNAVVRLGATSKIVAESSMISYWAFDALKHTLSDEVRPWVPLEGNYWGDLAMIVLLLLIFVTTAYGGIKLKDRHR